MGHDALQCPTMAKVEAWIEESFGVEEYTSDMVEGVDEQKVNSTLRKFEEVEKKESSMNAANVLEADEGKAHELLGVHGEIDEVPNQEEDANVDLALPLILVEKAFEEGHSILSLPPIEKLSTNGDDLHSLPLMGTQILLHGKNKVTEGSPLKNIESSLKDARCGVESLGESCMTFGRH